MKYMGSKAKVARYIVPIIQEQIERSDYETYLEPFCGGCNVIDKIEAPQRIASDCNKYLIALMQHIQAGGELPGYIEREEYAKVRANRDDYPEWYAGYVGFVASYNGRFFDGGYSGKTQTTGLDPEKDQIIELAAALVTENGIELKIDAFCKLPEGEKIPEKIVELTHITDDMLADKGIDYREACRIFCNMLHSDSEVLLVAHNIQFDLLFILEMFKRCGMVPKAPKLRALDSLTVYKDRAAYPHKLANAIEHYGLADKVQNSHRAIDDVLALYEVTKAMSEERDDLTDYIDLLGYNPKYGITGRKLRQITYMPQSYKLGCRLPDLMNGGGSCE